MTEIVMIGCNKLTSLTCALCMPFLDIERIHLVDDDPVVAKRVKLELGQMDLEPEISVYHGIEGVPPNVTLAVYAQSINSLLDVKTAKKYIPYARSFSGVWITTTYPVDTLNWFFSHYIPHEKCIGFGNQIDSARVDAAVRELSPDLMAVAFGEHDGYFVPIIRDGNLNPDNDAACPKDNDWRDIFYPRIPKQVGFIAPAYHLTNLISSVLDEDYSRWHPASVITDGAFLQESYGFGWDVMGGISIGLSAHIGGDGVIEYDDPPMDAWEKAKMRSAMASIDAKNRSILEWIE